MKWQWLRIIFSIVLFSEVALLAHGATVQTTVTTTPAVSILSQRSFQWFENADNLDPGALITTENATINAQPIGTQLRLRMNIRNGGGATFPAGASFTLQYANATSGPWTNVSTSTEWSFFDNPSVADGQIIVTPLLSSSTVGESYAESNPSAAMPTQLLPVDVGEWDWVLVNISATTTANWLFRMVNASGTPLNDYTRYPKLTAVAPAGGGGPPVIMPPIQVGGGVSFSATSTSSTFPFLPPPRLPVAFQAADFNADNRVDIIDLSILLYFYGRSDKEALRHDLSRNGVVGFADVSVLMYYWTG